MAGANSSRRTPYMASNIVLCLTLVNLLSALLHYQLVYGIRGTGASVHGEMPTQDRSLNELPLFVSPMAFTIEPETSHYSLYAHDEWASLIPPGHGWVRLGLDGRYYAVSMYHQLHCVDQLRYTIRLARAAAYPHSNTTTSDIESEIPHVHHCLNYLRQALLCQSDTTLEPSQLVVDSDGQRHRSAPSAGVTHQCRDWTKIREYVERNQEEWKGVPAPEE